MSKHLSSPHSLRPANSKPIQSRPAFSLVELLVSLMIVATLTGLGLPAVQHAREAARATQCQSQLRQLALAAHNYQAARGHFPVGTEHKYELLPFLERNDLYQRKLPVDPIDPAAAWLPLQSEPVPLFYCPSDSGFSLIGSETGDLAGTNYHGNAGTGVLADGFNGLFGYGDDAPYPLKDSPVRPAMIRDGLSATVAFSEALLPGIHPRVTEVWLLPQEYLLPEEQLTLAKECQSIPLDPSAAGYVSAPFPRGFPWCGGGMGNALYTHTLPPNHPSCTNGPTLVTGVYTATSQHPHSVHAAFADGHVQRISQSIEASVWVDLGSRESSHFQYPF